MEKVNCLFNVSLKFFFSMEVKNETVMKQNFTWGKFWWQCFIGNFLFSHCCYSFLLIFFSFSQIWRPKAILSKIRLCCDPGSPREPFWRGEPPGPPSPVCIPAFLVLARVLCTASWGTARLWDTLKSHRKNGEPLGLCQGMGSTWALGRSRGKKWG